jgi:hypothetical protein
MPNRQGGEKLYIWVALNHFSFTLRYIGCGIYVYGTHIYETHIHESHTYMFCCLEHSQQAQQLLYKGSIS